MNSTQFTVKLRADSTRKDGTSSLYLYANINGKRKYYSLRKSILPKYWNEEKQEVNSRCDNWHIINRKIKDYISKAEDLTARANLDNRIIKLSDLDYLLRGVQYDHNNIISFIDNDIKLFGETFSPGTIAVYRTLSNKIEAFQKDISFQELTPFWWRQFENTLIAKGSNKNTVFKAFKTLKTFIHRAMEQGVIRENPLISVKVDKAPGQMTFLTLNEINKLEGFYKGFMTKDLKRVLQYFLFACYTGLRYSDIVELKFKHLFEGNYIEKEIFKTKTINRIPLNNRAKALLPKMVLNEKTVFNVYCNQTTNRHLKNIMKLAKINKRISFHCARHTFATITLELSGDIAAVQKVLGHTKIETTQLYAKVLDNQKQAAVDKWNAV
ncbi:MAG: site-specific integrase [Bacteroidota bacterium]